MKITVTALVTFEIDTEDADQDLVLEDQVHSCAVLSLPYFATLEEIVSWEKS